MPSKRRCKQRRRHASWLIDRAFYVHITFLATLQKALLLNRSGKDATHILQMQLQKINRFETRSGRRRDCKRE
jgi:hypothetical protein